MTDSLAAARVREGRAGAAGRLNASVARAVVGIYRRHVGRGPTKAQSLFRDDVLVVVLEDVLTQAERSLVAGGRTEAVRGMRREFEGVMRDEMMAAVHDLTGRRVVAFMSDHDVASDAGADVFLLDGPVRLTDD